MAEKLNVSALARECRCHPNTLYRYQSEGCPIEEGADAIKAWLALREEQKRASSAEASDLQERKLLAECAKLEADAESKELKNSIARGEVINTDEANEELAERLIHAKAMLESMVDDIAKECPQELRVKVREIAKHAADRFYRKVANWKPGESVDI